MTATTPDPVLAAPRPRRARIFLALVGAAALVAPLLVLASSGGRARVLRLLLHGPEGTRAWAIEQLDAMGPAGVEGLFEAYDTEPPFEGGGVLSFADDPMVVDRIIDGAHPDAIDVYAEILEGVDPDAPRGIASECLIVLLGDDFAEEPSRPLDRAERLRVFRVLLRARLDEDDVYWGGSSPVAAVAEHATLAEVAALLPILLDERDHRVVSGSSGDLVEIVADAADGAIAARVDALEGTAVEPELLAGAEALLAGLRERMPAIVELLGSADEDLAIPAGLLLDALAPESRDAIIARLDDPSPHARLRAAVWLASEHDLWWLEDPDVDEETGLWRLHDALVDRVLAVLIEGIGEPALSNDWLADEVVEGVGRLLERRGREDELDHVVLEAVSLALRHADPARRRAALAAMLRASYVTGRPPPEVVDAVIPALGDSDAEARGTAAYLLSRVGPEIGPRVAPLLGAEDQATARAALFALVHSGAPVGADALPVLRAGLASTDWSVREEQTRIAFELPVDVIMEILPLLVARVGDTYVTPDGYALASGVGSLLEQLGAPAIPAVEAALPEATGGRRDELASILQRLRSGVKSDPDALR